MKLSVLILRLPNQSNVMKGDKNKTELNRTPSIVWPLNLKKAEQIKRGWLRLHNATAERYQSGPLRGQFRPVLMTTIR